MRRSLALADKYPEIEFVTLQDGWYLDKISRPTGEYYKPAVDWSVPPGTVVFSTKSTWLRHKILGSTGGVWMRKGEIALYMGPEHRMAVTSQALIMLGGEMYSASCQDFVLDSVFLPKK